MPYTKTNWDYTTTPLNPTNLNKIEEGIYQAVRKDEQANILYGSGIKGSGTGMLNISYFSFFESDGTTSQGLVGFGSSGNKNLYLANSQTDGNIVFQTTSLSNKVLFNNYEIYHAGNIASFALNLANLSGIKGSGTGATNSSVLEFNEADGTTRQGFIGFGYGTGQLVLKNEITDKNIDIATTGTGIATVNGNKIFHTGNDGAGSTLDADLLDGQHGSYYQPKPTTSNTSFGNGALLNYTSGTNNTSIGYSSMQFISTGYGNTALGYDAGRLVASGASNTTSYNSVYVGKDTRPSADGNQNEIVIGYDARGYGHNTAHIGNSSVSSISFGAGTGTAFTNRSDRRLKEDIIDADVGICYNDIKNLPLHRFKYKDFVGNEGDIHLTGFIADEFETIFPKAVHKANHTFMEKILDENGNEVEEEILIENCSSIDTSQLTPTIVGALKALIAKVETLEAEIQSLKV